MQIPGFVQTSRNVASRAISAPVKVTQNAARGVTCFCQSRGITYRHVTALTGMVTGVFVSALLVRSAGRKGRRGSHSQGLEWPEHSKADAKVLAITKEESDDSQQDIDEAVEECMHIIFSGNGIYKRTTYDSSPSLMFAWPKIVLDYK